jgi:hypothetical protein
MRRPVIALLVGFCLGSPLAGCATITTGTTQPINFNSEPQQAECTLTREGQTLGTVTTPGPLVIKRNASTIHVVCRKAGYEEGHVVMNSRFETASAGNFLVGGIIGVMVDASSGANSRYESNVMVRLTPMSPADMAAAAAGSKAAPTPRPSPVPTPSPSPVPPRMFTGAWKATAVLVTDRSGLNCARDGGAYSLDLTDDKLTVDSANGRVLSTAVPADGALSQSFKSSSGSTPVRTLSPSIGGAPTLDMVGNARTRDLEIVDNNAGCRWKLMPVSAAAAAVPPPAAPVGPYDGDYRGGLQLGALLPGNSYERVSEAIRTIEIHVSSGVATGTVRQERCTGIGTVNLQISPTGVVSGELDALVTTTCAPLKVQVEGRVNGDLLTALATAGRASTEFSLRRAANP